MDAIFKNITMFPHKEIILSDEIRRAAPRLKVLVIEAEIKAEPTSEGVKTCLREAAASVSSRFDIPDINQRPAIKATRDAYKSCGKDPNRYRPSQEQLCRRILQGKELYFISNVVDVINAVSILSGYAIGGFDAEAIEGGLLTLGIGREGEPYEGIGRGELNIAGMPVYRDSKGGVGTPTSDNERTKTSLSTRYLLMTINIYGEEMSLEATADLTRRLLEEHCSLKYFNSFVIS